MRTILIIRHSNDKYYDSSCASYITLEEIKEEILLGNRIIVRTVGNKTDITSTVLSRIRVDQLKHKSVESLVKLIKLGA